MGATFESSACAVASIRRCTAVSCNAPNNVIGGACAFAVSTNRARHASAFGGALVMAEGDVCGDHEAARARGGLPSMRGEDMGCRNMPRWVHTTRCLDASLKVRPQGPQISVSRHAGGVSPHGTTPQTTS